MGAACAGRDNTCGGGEAIRAASLMALDAKIPWRRRASPESSNEACLEMQRVTEKRGTGENQRKERSGGCNPSREGRRTINWSSTGVTGVSRLFQAAVHSAGSTNFEE